MNNLFQHSPYPRRFIHRVIHWRHGIPHDFILNPATEKNTITPGLELASDLLRIMPRAGGGGH